MTLKEFMDLCAQPGLKAAILLEILWRIDTIPRLMHSSLVGPMIFRSRRYGADLRRFRIADCPIETIRAPGTTPTKSNWYWLT